MSNAIESEHHIEATNNAIASINQTTKLPDYIFSRSWSEMIFMDEYWLFEPSFIGYIQKILATEGAQVACLRNLRAAVGGNTEVNFFIDQQSTPENFLSFLNGTQMWRSLVDDYVCSSDTGNWTIYCEKSNDISIVATSDKHTYELFSEFLLPDGGQKLSSALRTLEQHSNDRVFFPPNLKRSWSDKLVESFRAQSQR